MRLTRAMLLTIVLTTGGAVTASALAPIPAFAQDKNAERLRLEEEMKKLAQRNAWTGVERKYQELMDLNVELPFDDHMLGAQAARYQGKTLELYNRLKRALAMKSDAQDVVDELAAIDDAYGRVHLKGSERFLPQVKPAVMPFAPDQQKSIARASEVMSNTGSFEGMLPLGDYTVACQQFTVVRGEGFLDIAVEKPKKKELDTCLGGALAGGGGGGGGGSETPGTRGAIAYNGPVVSLGYNFMSNGEPGEPVASLQDETLYQAQAQSVAGSGIAAQLGYELGFTGADSMFGVAVTVGYTGMYNGKTSDARRPSSFNAGTAWLAGTVRPGDLRIAAGPTWSMIYGSGTGAACWFELAPGETWDDSGAGDDACTREDPAYEPNAIQWRGLSLAPGAALSVGYGVMEVGDFMGVVELGGSWSTDGERQIVNAGLRVGIVPAIDRFER